MRALLLQRTHYQSALGSVFRRYHHGGLYERWVLPWYEQVRTRTIARSYGLELGDDLRSFAAHLPRSPRRILDIGCGLAGIDVLLNRHYLDTRPEFWLLDRFHVDERVYYGFESQAAAYAQRAETEDFVLSNGLIASQVRMVDIEREQWPVDVPFDLVVSLISWGFHYPVDTYVARVAAQLSEDGVVVLDVRDGSGGLEVLARWFGHLEAVSETRKCTRVVARDPRQAGSCTT